MKEKSGAGRRKYGLAICVLLMLMLLLPTVSAVPAPQGPQTWYLDSVNSGVGDTLVMEKTGTQSGNISISHEGQSVMWIADKPAAADVPIAGGENVEWKLSLESNAAVYDLLKLERVDLIKAQIGVLNSTGFHPFTSVTKIEDYQDLSSEICKTVVSIAIYLQNSNETIKKGEYLALKITLKGWPFLCNPWVIHTGDRTYLRSPWTDPGYPLAELSSLALMSVGMLGMVGAVYLRQRKH